MKLSAAFLVAFTSLVLASDIACAADRDDIVGEWLTANGEAKIRFAFESTQYVGRVTWLKTSTKDGKPVVDENNPDPNLRTRQMMGAAIVWNMHFDGKEYVDGLLYDPEHGKTYKGKAVVESTNRLSLRGYVGIPLFGKSETWTRTAP